MRSRQLQHPATTGVLEVPVLRPANFLSRQATLLNPSMVLEERCVCGPCHSPLEGYTCNPYTTRS